MLLNNAKALLWDLNQGHTSIVFSEVGRSKAEVRPAHQKL